jgi:cytochrome c-type biogenesis protein CcmH
MKFWLQILPVTLIVLSAALVATAQEGAQTVTADQVNAIASKLYCPVCENIPLDACGTAACTDWRNEIRLQLEAGMTEEAITTDFVRRFGDRVVGTPQDPLLRALSLVTPWLLIGLGFVGGALFIVRQRTHNSAHTTQTATASSTNYHDQLERDLQG